MVPESPRRLTLPTWYKTLGVRTGTVQAVSFRDASMSTTCGGAVVVIKQMCMIYVWALPRQVEAAVADEHTDTRRALKSLKLSLEQVRANPFSALTGEGAC